MQQHENTHECVHVCVCVRACVCVCACMSVCVCTCVQLLPRLLSTLPDTTERLPLKLLGLKHNINSINLMNTVQFVLILTMDLVIAEYTQFSTCN